MSLKNTHTDLEATKRKNAETWEDNFYKVYGYMPAYAETPEEYRDVLWTEY